jgi:hypothetical protein
MSTHLGADRFGEGLRQFNQLSCPALTLSQPKLVIKASRSMRSWESEPTSTVFGRRTDSQDRMDLDEAYRREVNKGLE